MGHYVKHIVTIDEDSTREKLEKLRDIIDEHTDFNFKVFDDHIDDRNWNTGSGISHFDDMWWTAISERFGEIAFTVHCVTENGAIYDIYCFDGNTDECMYRNTDEWYKHYANAGMKDRAPGARKGYYEDYGPGDDYPVLYGGVETVPAGPKWWELAEQDVKPRDWSKKGQENDEGGK